MSLFKDSSQVCQVLVGYFTDKIKSLCVPVNERQVEETYNTIGVNIFSQNFLEGARGWMVSHSYYNTPMFEKILQNFVGTTRTIDTKRTTIGWDGGSRGSACNVALVSSLVSDERITPFVFRNYLHPLGHPSK